MIYYCDSCGGPLKFDVESGNMCCDFCGVSFNPEQLKTLKTEEYSEAGGQSFTGVFKRPAAGPNNKNIIDLNAKRTLSQMKMQDFSTARKSDELEINVCTCNSCGATLYYVDKEFTSRCAYCGNMTVSFERIDTMGRPDSIIPFKVSKEQAETAVKKRISAMPFARNAIRHFKTDDIQGVYVPYRLFDVLLNVDMTGLERETNRFYTYEGSAMLNEILIDSSPSIPDTTSALLEPFDLSQKISFDPIYLTGFAADAKADDDELVDDTKSSIMRIYNQYINKNRSDDMICEDRTDFQIKNYEEILLPVWFLTFSEKIKGKDVSYTIIINGQTGKIVGAVPFSKAKYYLLMAIVAVITTAVVMVLPISANLSQYFNAGFDNPFWVGFVAFFCLLFLSLPGIFALDKLRAAVDRTQSEKVLKFLGKRRNNQ